MVATLTLCSSVCLQESKGLGRHLEECLTCYRFPEPHWKHIHTCNVLERSFREVKRRTNVIGRFPTEMADLSVVFVILEGERTRWQRVRMKWEDIACIEEAVKSLDTNPITAESFQAVAA
ncbi:MAG: transposase [Dehalococcoidia bacterium]|nr:transposase [Dehalococcoidia bacterium]